MKNILLITILSLVLISCDKPLEKQTEKTNEPTVIGSAMMDDGKINPIIGGDLNTQKVWLAYIQAHNDRNLDKITEINATEWEAYLPDGGLVKGQDAQIELLNTWFKTSNPKWKVQWMITNNSKNEEGIMTQWLTTGNDLTDTDQEGNETIEHQVHDIQFIDGKIKKINIYTRSKTEK